MTVCRPPSPPPPPAVPVDNIARLRDAAEFRSLSSAGTSADTEANGAATIVRDDRGVYLAREDND